LYIYDKGKVEVNHEGIICAVSKYFFLVCLHPWWAKSSSFLWFR